MKKIKILEEIEKLEKEIVSLEGKQFDCEDCLILYAELDYQIEDKKEKIEQLKEKLNKYGKRSLVTR
jgi:predicted PolB exonuclease-like 3'-5' exonuclease